MKAHGTTLAVLLSLGLAWAPPALAQDAANDDPLDGLLKKLEESQPSAPAPAPAEPKGDDALDGLLKKIEELNPPAPAESKGDDALDGLLKKIEESTPPADKGGSMPTGELAPKDEALDNLLEKLGQTEETPAPDGRRAAPGGMPPPEPDAGPLKGKEKDLDEHLEDLTGRKRKKKDQDGDGGEGNPLSDLVKKMRDVEERLGEPDTGTDTRQKQRQIVESIDQIIEQLRNSQGQGQGKLTRMAQQQQGPQPGQKPGQPGAQGNTGQGVGASKPSRPTSDHVAAGGKDAWGHLPPELRGMMENVFREEELPAKADLIRRYYLSVSEKSQPGGEQ